jgi:hypothetical protein
MFVQSKSPAKTGEEMANNLVDVACIIRHETEKAYLVDHGGKESVWIPKSKCEVEPNKDGKTATVTLEQWLAEEKGMV